MNPPAAGASPRQDIFGLGVTLFRLATGEFPYPQLVAIAAEDEPRWSEDLGRPIPFILEEVLRRAVRASPALRQHSMADVADQLQLAADELAAEDQPPPGREASPARPTAPAEPAPRAWPWKGSAIVLAVCLAVDLGLRLRDQTRAEAESVAPLAAGDLVTIATAGGVPREHRRRADRTDEDATAVVALEPAPVPAPATPAAEAAPATEVAGPPVMPTQPSRLILRLPPVDGGASG